VRADEIDAIGTKRYESQSGGEREIQRTMLELLNQMDGFDSMGDVKARRARARLPAWGSQDPKWAPHDLLRGRGCCTRAWLAGHACAGAHAAGARV